MLDALLQELLVDVHVMPGLAVGLHVVFLAGQLRGVGGVEAGCGGFVMLELPAQRKLRVPLGVLAVDVGACQRVAVRTARLAGAALTGLQDDLGAAGLDLVVRAPVLPRGEFERDVGRLAIELDRLLGEVEDGRGDDIAFIVLDADLDVGFLELRRVAVLRRRAVGEVSCSCATRLVSLWSTELSSASGAAVQGLSSFAALLSPDLVLPLCWDVDCV